MNSQNNRLIMIAAGGTAGHVYPGIAVGMELLKRNMRIHFIVRTGDAVIPLLKKHHIDFSEINVRGWDRSFSVRLFLVCVLFIRSLFQAVRIIRACRPAVVVGMGGYVSLPAVISARLMRLPVLIHEQNSYPGLANRLVSSFVQKIAISYEETKSFFNPLKTVRTGNPLRIDFTSMDKRDARKRLGLHPDTFVVFVFGGSQGAGSLNRGIIEALPLLKKHISEKPSFIHIAGEKDCEGVKRAYQAHGFTAVVYTFCFEMNVLYSAADLVVCRAGAATISELVQSKKPAILVPYPHAAADHQMKNALHLSRQGCAEIIIDKDISGIMLSETILRYIKNSDKLVHMIEQYAPLKENARAASPLLAQEVLSLIFQQKSPSVE